MIEKITKNQIIFEKPPMAVVTIPKGKLGYRRTTTLRLMGRAGEVCFKLKGNRIYFQTENLKVFKRKN